MDRGAGWIPTGKVIAHVWIRGMHNSQVWYNARKISDWSFFGGIS